MKTYEQGKHNGKNKDNLNLSLNRHNLRLLSTGAVR